MPKVTSEKPRLDDSISLSDLARLLDLTPRRVNQLAAEGAIPKAKRGEYALEAAVRAYVAYLKDEARRSSKSAAASRVTDARTQEIELRILERSGDLLKAARADALAVTDQILGGIRADLAAAPARITADLELRRKIETVLNDALAAAAKRSADAAAGVDEGDEPSDAGRPVEA